MRMSGTRVFIRIISAFLSVIFFFQETGWTEISANVPDGAGIAARKMAFSAGEIRVPYGIAGTEEIVSCPGKDIIVHIQDAHSSLSAQYSIASLLDSLVKDYDMRVIALEGASGFVDTSILKTFPDKEIRENTAKFLMREGRMSAGEFFTVTHDENEIDLYGIEDDELYRANVESFRKVASGRAARLENVNALCDELKKLEEVIYSEDLRLFNSASSAHREGKLSFADYWEKIRRVIEKNGSDLSEYADLMKLRKSLELEKTIDFDAASSQRRALIDELSGKLGKEKLERLVLMSLDFKDNKMSQEDFHAYLLDEARENGISLEKYENLVKFAEYVSQYASVDLVKLYRQVEEFENSIRESLYRNHEERDLYKFSKTGCLLRQLYSMELTGDESAYIRGNRKDFSAEKISSFINAKCLKYKIPITGGYDGPAVFGGIDAAMEFYSIAERRNQAMIANTVDRMRKENRHVAALITGGYHTDGLTELMRKKELSYLVVIPKFDKDKERPYIAILTNKKKAYEKVLDSGRYQLAVEAFFTAAKGDLSRMKSAIFYACGEAILKGRESEIESIKEIWARSYALRYDTFIQGKKKDMAFDPPSPLEFRDFLFNRFTWHRIGNTVVMGDKTVEGYGFVALVRAGKGDYFEFDLSSEAHRKMFTAREERRSSEGLSKEEMRASDFLGALDASIGDIPGLKPELARDITGRESLLEKMDSVAEVIAAEVYKIKDKDDLRKEVINRLRRLGLPAYWKEAPDPSEKVEMIVARAMEQRVSKKVKITLMNQDTTVVPPVSAPGLTGKINLSGVSGKNTGKKREIAPASGAGKAVPQDTKKIPRLRPPSADTKRLTPLLPPASPAVKAAAPPAIIKKKEQLSPSKDDTAGTESLEDCLNRAEKAFAENRLSEAVDAAGKAMSMDKNNRRALVSLGGAYGGLYAVNNRILGLIPALTRQAGRESAVTEVYLKKHSGSIPYPGKAKNADILKEISAALEHAGERLSGAEKELNAKKADYEKLERAGSLLKVFYGDMNRIINALKPISAECERKWITREGGGIHGDYVKKLLVELFGTVRLGDEESPGAERAHGLLISRIAAITHDLKEITGQELIKTEDVEYLNKVLNLSIEICREGLPVEKFREIVLMTGYDYLLSKKEMYIVKKDDDVFMKSIRARGALADKIDEVALDKVKPV
ncbi:MAG: hypothetical protein ABH883_01025 [Candidatus Omnitrophota bacterium]